MRFSRRTLFSLLAVACFRAGAGDDHRAHAQSDEGVVLLLNARNPTQSLTSTETAKIFLGQTAFWHGVVAIKVMTRPDTSNAAKLFYRTVLKQTPQAFRKHWDELQLSGRGVAPRVYASAEELAQAIAQTPGGVGFALYSELWKVQTKGIKIVNVR